MSNIVDVRTLVFEGAKPNEETIQNIIQNRREEKNQVVEDIKINTMYLGAKAIEKYLVTILFAEKKQGNNSLFTDDHGMDVQELNEEDLDEELEGDIEIDDLDLDSEDL